MPNPAVRYNFLPPTVSGWLKVCARRVAVFLFGFGGLLFGWWLGCVVVRMDAGKLGDISFAIGGLAGRCWLLEK